MAPGTSQRIEVWLAADTQTTLLRSYQLAWQQSALPAPDATGAVTYIDNNPGGGGGDTVFLDTTREDFAFFDSVVLFDPQYFAVPADNVFGVDYITLIVEDQIDPFLLAQPLYLGEFDIAASEDAYGDHLFVWNLETVGGVPPIAAFFTPTNLSWEPLAFQDLLVQVRHSCEAGDPGACDDEDPCTIDSCVEEFCVHEDVSGQPCVDDTDCAAIADRTCIQGACVCPARNVVFLDTVGQAGVNRPPVGPAEIVMLPGEVRRIEVWLSANVADTVLLSSYQLVLLQNAQPLPGALGGVVYVDNDPGGPPGDSLWIDMLRPDWVFAGSIAPNSVPVLSESMDLAGQPAFALIYWTLIQIDDVDTFNLPQPRYLCEFDIAASEDACGDFLFEWNALPDPIEPPIALLFGPGGGATYPAEFEDLLIHIPCQCNTVADCADLNGDGRRDDRCTYWACVDNTCTPTAVGFGDMGGQFGACEVDGATDGNDFFQALNCFANLDINGNPGAYPCESHPAYPPTAFNVDAVGQFSSCVTDGVCDGNDALAALDAFNGNPACSCPEDGDPAPTFDGPIEVVEHAAITLRGDRKRIRPGTTVAVDVLLDRPLADLRGYQLHIAVEGGHRGALELIDISVAGAVFAGRAAWDAYNVSTWQMVAGLYDRGMATPTGAHLATFTFAASKDAVGTFVVDLLHDDSDRTQRTFLFPTGPRAQIGIARTTPAVIEVGRGAAPVRSPARR